MTINVNVCLDNGLSRGRRVESENRKKETFVVNGESGNDDDGCCSAHGLFRAHFRSEGCVRGKA